MKYKLEVFALSDVGKVRKNNEDTVLTDPSLGLAIVADGMGGHSSGEVASSLAAKVTRDKFREMQITGLKPGNCDENLALETNQLGFAVQLANSVIYEAGNAAPENKGMGTTLSAILLNGGRISIAHIGDSRVYLLRDGVLQQMTEDHSLVMDHVRKGLLTLEQAEKSPLQNILTRALGTQKSPAVDLKEVPVMEDDRFLLCTDGLFKAVGTDKIAGILGSTADGQKACELLVRTANDNGGPDNVTVALGILKKKTL
ncbi:MAG TPA: Stp1/IreP family PP2C-type Ser/Thr phosphatase, partial [Elusimicrobiales bacterium]|nr:Stp1/IreP family PP2C-type Ser/Thr phosphatase [Elusimicrobiales bacterium]